MPVFKNEQFFGKRRQMSHEESKNRRFAVYDYISNNVGKNINNLDLARAAGYKCQLKEDRTEYKRGIAFISQLIRNGFISYVERPGEGKYWYIEGKDKDYAAKAGVVTTQIEQAEELPFGEEEKPKKESFKFNCSIHMDKEEKEVSIVLEDITAEELLAKIKNAVEILK